MDLKESQALLRTTLDSSFSFIQVFVAVRDEKDAIVDFTWLLTNKKWNNAYGDVIGKSLLAEHPAVVERGF